MSTPRTIDDYLSKISEDVRVVLEKLRTTIRDAAPDTEETISYQMPTFKYKGKALLGFAAFKNHCSVFPYSKSVMVTLEEELRPFDIESKGATIRFTIDEPLPPGLIKKLVKARKQEIDSA